MIYIANFSLRKGIESSAEFVKLFDAVEALGFDIERAAVGEQYNLQGAMGSIQGALANQAEQKRGRGRPKKEVAAEPADPPLAQSAEQPAPPDAPTPSPATGLTELRAAAAGAIGRLPENRAKVHEIVAKYSVGEGGAAISKIPEDHREAALKAFRDLP